jgi:hypothetical protein
MRKSPSAESAWQRDTFPAKQCFILINDNKERVTSTSRSMSRHDVLNVSEGGKVVHHPLAGELTFDFLWFQTVDSRDLRLLIHTPRSHSGTAEKIERLLALESE